MLKPNRKIITRTSQLKVGDIVFAEYDRTPGKSSRAYWKYLGDSLFSPFYDEDGFIWTKSSYWTLQRISVESTSYGKPFVSLATEEDLLRINSLKLSRII